ncbi:MAG TPA: gliding motility-associated C-terminal domain-containing protein [Chitinophagales bacterium]|nr:gliding motility-associated C-terminal domain-containing protein [Chitinophagales bacterium]
MKQSAILASMVFTAICISFHPFGQPSQRQPSPEPSAANWMVAYQPSKAFIENKGQFQLRKPCGEDSEVLYACHQGGLKIYFTRNGVSFSFTESKPYKQWRKEQGYDEEEEKFESVEEWLEEEKKERSAVVKRDDVSYYWQGANKNAEVIAGEMVPEYFSYSFYTENGIKNENFLRGYRQLTYKNLYPHIDVVYEFHPQDGIKYSIIVHPGGDVSQVKMVYSGEVELNSGSDVHIPTAFGNIIDHAPVTFYEKRKHDLINCRFEKNGPAVSFRLDDYNRTETIVIDPWVQTPNFATNWDCVWECDHDGAGNVYIIGGVMPMQLLKYNPAGVLQWTYNTPYDTTAWLGTFATDDAGNSYVTNGSLAAIQKVNTAGGLVWNNPNPGGLLTLTEFWNIAFNCDQTKLVIAGTDGVLTPSPFIFDVNTNTGNVTNSIQVTGSSLFGFPPKAQEVRSITACYNARYYFLTHDSIGYIHQNLTSCVPPNSTPFHVSNGYSLGYKCENWRYNNTGIMAIRYYGGFIYTHRGDQVHKRDFNTAAIIATATIPGGGFISSFGNNQVENSGIDIDDCGNVYVGSKTGVVKYDQNLNQLATYPTSFVVYDVKVSTGGNIIACGSTGTSSASVRTGGIQSFAVSACAPQAHVCCDASACPAGPFCSTDAPVNLTASQPGGTWSGTGIINAATGTFSPSAAGPGTHTIYHTVACGTDSIYIVVNLCGVIDACRENNGNITASGGDGGPYTFQQPGYTQNCSACLGFPFPPCSFPPGCAVNTLTWNTFATGTTATPPPGADSVRIVDGSGNELIIPNISTLPPCSACPSINVSIAATQPLCFGTTGSATASASGGAAPYSYLWQPGGLSGASQSSLAAGTYTITATDASGCTGTGSVTLTAPTAISLSTSKTDATCAGNDGTAAVTASGGTPPYSYSWSNGAASASVSGLQAGNYSVTVNDNNNCTAAAGITISSTGGPTVSLISQTNISCNGATDGAADISVSGGTPPYTFLWTNGATTEDVSGLTPGAHSVTVTDNLSCVSVFNVSITEPSALSVSGIVTNTGCALSVGAVDVTVSGGTPAYSYSWTTGAATQDVSNLSEGNYTVTVTDANSCQAINSFTINTVPACCTLQIAATVSNPGCGLSDGAIDITITTGSGSYSFLWNNSATTEDLSNVPAGSYSVTVTDIVQTCDRDTTVNLSNPNAPIITSISSTPETCLGDDDGTATVVASGGTGTLTYLWSSNQTGATITGLAPGNYSVTITDANNCQATGTTTVQAGQVCCTLTSTATTIDASCSLADGSLTITVDTASGTAPFSYSIDGVNYVATNTFSNLAAGTYSAIARDANLCADTSTVVVAEANNTLSLTTTGTNVTCFGYNDGMATVIVSGGNPPVTYLWSNNSSISTIINLSPGVYYVTVTDQSNCQRVDSVTISGRAQLVVNIDDVSFCAGDSATLSVSGSFAQIRWSTGDTTPSIIVTQPGNISVQVTDTAGCLATDNAAVTVNTPPAVDAGLDTTIYDFESVVLQPTVSGTVNPSGFVWSPSTGLSDATIRNPIASPDSSIIYKLVYTDNNGCSASDSVIFTVVEGEFFAVVPNAFSPNGDDVNDILYVYSKGLKRLVFRVYNRWGSKVFESRDPSVGWDGTFRGKLLDPAVFVYELYAEYLNFTAERKTGSVTLVR